MSPVNFESSYGPMYHICVINPLAESSIADHKVPFTLCH